ncbi:AraC family transcriptional regulator [Segetibacter sp. 3557_3]|uniref:helix-turn-helix domain-containing protein n=1 Tax=Segetibacter sp. 3557_3 TaxID=2547429 RepID=UPI001058AB54|nr:response regulator transcription factor [Segetibacter sp. 3557_3]TDH24553.1 AraC family transcriptional regulator [Segetibacter sp. 3557_3]
MATQQPVTINSITEFHQLRGYPRPEHPLISVVNFDQMKTTPESEPVNIVHSFYSVALKRCFHAKMKYGQQEYDFDEGVMFFISPGQVFSIHAEKDVKHSGWSLLVHPDFLWNTPLAQKIRQFEYFSYSVHEALFLSEKEEKTILSIMQNIENEYRANIDRFSQQVIIAQLELLFTYSERFYERQFITRKISNHRVLNRLEELLTAYFAGDQLAKRGLPTVHYVADSLNISQGYLSSLLKTLTGKSTQQHIQDKLIDKAKEKLSITDLSVSEVAYELGFEQPQSFSKLFKLKTNLSPLEFRQSFN